MKERIRSIMQSMRLSQQDFANRLGISAASLSSIFTGRTNPTNNHVMAVHRAFPEININWLMFGEGEMMAAATPGEEGKDGEGSETASATAGTADDAATTSVDVRHPSLFSAQAPHAAHAPFPAQTTVGTPRRDTPFHQRRAAEMNVSAINIDRKERKIKEIRVFFDDGTYESFVPSSK